MTSALATAIELRRWNTPVDFRWNDSSRMLELNSTVRARCWGGVCKNVHANGQASAEPTVGLTEADYTRSGSCAALCSRFGSSSSFGQCGSCGGVTKTLQPLAVQREPVTEPVSSLDRPSNESKSVLPDEFVTRLFFSSRRVRIRSGLTPLAVCSVLAMLSGCAVYDSSLLSDTGSPLANGGESSLGGFADAGGAPGGASNGGSANAGDPPAFDDAGAGGDPSAQGGAGGAATAGASASAGKNSGGSAQGGSAQAGSAQAGSAQAGSAQAGAAQAGSSGTAGASGVDSPRDLTTGKSATASTQQTGNEIEKGNDGNSSTRWCGKDDSLPQWWRVDLGASHQLSSFSVSFQIATRAYTYDIETSPDDKVYTRRLTITGTGAVQTGDFPAGVNARYVRITVTKAEPFANGATVWASFYEFSVLGI